ncbi:MAG: hypothetical protein LBU39_08450 [Desulfobulbaceae bacterium]|jgi:hypothetical protein|nr:hypothetical protein [Desulfobulbaceae bacterium]
MSWDTIFTAGWHTDSQGRRRQWTENDLDELAKSTDVPLVALHPKEPDKAAVFGQVAALRRVGRDLQASYTALSKDVVALVKGGLRLCKSVSIDPEAMRLKHVGLLGADQPPAVDGLGYVSFTRKGEIELSLQGEDMDKDAQIADLQRQVAELLAKKDAGTMQAALDHSKNELAASVTREQAEKLAREKVEAEFATFRQERQEADLKARVERLAASGRILPTETNLVFACAKAISDSVMVDFAKTPGGQTEKLTAREAYLCDMEARPENHCGLLGEFARKDGTGGEEPLDLSKINQFA